MSRLPGSIVVGVDGSPGSLAALRFALVEARLRGASVAIVHAWLVPLVNGLPGPVLAGVPVEYGMPIDELREAVRESAEQSLGDALRELAEEAEGVEVEWQAVEGPPAKTLFEAAAGADLLVVGSRGHGGFKGLLLGSVSQQCAHHAPCPVVIVPSRDGEGSRLGST